MNKNLILIFFFTYFLVTSADLIGFDIGGFNLKLPHLAGLITFVIFLCGRKIVVEKKIFLCFLLLLSSMLISSFKSVVFSRSLIYSFIYVFSFFAYFLVPFNLMLFGDENRFLKYYLLSFFVVGTYAFLQFFSSIFGIILPFTTQKIILARGSALALEPSFYALYAIPFIAYLNAKCLFSHSVKAEARTQKIKSTEPESVYSPLLLANLFLLISTTTTAIVSYLVFFLVLFFFPRFHFIRSCFFESRKKLLKLSTVFVSLFMIAGLIFFELFKKTFLKFFYVGLIHESFYTRFSGIFSAMKAFSENLMFGVGIGGISPYLFDQFGLNVPSVDLFDQRGLENRQVENLFSFEPTNVLSEILGSLGIYGFLGFCAFLIVLWTHFQNLLKDRRLLQEEKINILALLISVIVSLACLQVNQGLFRSYIWVHIGISLGYVMKIKTKLASR